VAAADVDVRIESVLGARADREEMAVAVRLADPASIAKVLQPHALCRAERVVLGQGDVDEVTKQRDAPQARVPGERDEVVLVGDDDVLLASLRAGTPSSGSPSTKLKSMSGWRVDKRFGAGTTSSAAALVNEATRTMPLCSPPIARTVSSISASMGQAAIDNEAVTDGRRSGHGTLSWGRNPTCGSPRR
jgi:hypothetical protein